VRNKPNIIHLQDDQHRWNALGCVNPLVYAVLELDQVLENCRKIAETNATP